MTPDEMKVLARVANRNAVEESPIVVDESRLIAPIDVPNDSGNFEERLDKLEVLQQDGINRVNQLESQLGQVLGANDSPVKVLASVVAQTRADVADLKSVRDVMRLNPADVLSGVIKPIKRSSNVELDDANFIIPFGGTGNSYLPYNDSNIPSSGGVPTGLKVVALKDIGEKPKNLVDLDAIGASTDVLTKISGDVSEINGFVKITSNSGIIDIDLTNKDYDLDIPKTELDPLSTETLVTVGADNVVDKFAGFSSGTLTESRQIVLAGLPFNGAYPKTVSAWSDVPTNNEAGYVLRQQADNSWQLGYHSGIGVAYAAHSITNTFTNTALAADAVVDVLFSNSVYMKLKWTNSSTSYTYYSTTALSGNNMLINGAKVGATAALYIVKPQATNATLSAQVQQTVNLVKPTTTNLYYRLVNINKIIKVSASTGLVDASADAGTIYFIEDGQIYTQATGAASLRNKLENNRWLFINSTKKFIQNNSNGTYGFPAAGYYSHDEQLVKFNTEGGIIYDRPSGEVANYKFKGGRTAKITIPTITPVSGATDYLNTPLVFYTVQLSDMYIDTDFVLKGPQGQVINSYNGLFFAVGDSGFKRANKLYQINNLGECKGHTGLAFLKIEEDSSSFAMRAWFTCAEGVVTPLSTNNYINSLNQVFAIGTSAPNATPSDYNNLVAPLGTSASAANAGLYMASGKPDASFTSNVFAHRDNLISGKIQSGVTAGVNGAISGGSAIEITASHLSRFTGEKLVLAQKYITLGAMYGNKSDMASVAALGGIEVISAILGKFSNKFMRVISGNSGDYELVFVNSTGYTAVASRTHNLISSNNIVKLNSSLFNIQTEQNNKLVKAVNGFVFNDDEAQNDLRMIKDDGSLDSALSSSSACRHFAWNVNGVKQVFYFDSVSKDLISVTADGYPNRTYTSDNLNKAVFLLQVPIASAQLADEEDVADSSSYTMHVLNMVTGNYSPILPPADSTKQWKFTAGLFDTTNEFRTVAQSVYWQREGSLNRPYLNRIVSVSSVKYSTDSMGHRSVTATVINGNYFTTPGNGLYYGSGGSLQSNVSQVQNKYYIDYDDNLAKSADTTGARVSVIPGNYFVVFDDNDYRSRYYSNGRMVLVTPGTLVAVASSKSAQHADHAHNGLKMWGKDSTGMFNRWLNMQADVARQANDAFVGEVKDLISAVGLTSTAPGSLNTGSAAPTTATANSFWADGSVLRYVDATTAIPDGLYKVATQYANLTIPFEDGTTYTTANNDIILILDGKVQDARAPRGTVVYTDAGIKVRTGLSAAQGTVSHKWA